jgi:hypothetical protein
VNRKISSTDFAGLNEPMRIPAWKRLIYWGGSLLITSFIVFFIINNLSTDNSNKTTFTTIDQQDGKNNLQPGRKDSFNIRNMDNNPIEGHPGKATDSKTQGTGAVVGLANGNAKSADTKGETLSFFEEIKFSSSADIKKFKSDIKIALENTSLDFKETKSKDELFGFVTGSIKGISDSKMPVDFYVFVKVDKRFPSTLKLSLRYVNEPGRNSYLRGESIETIFYERIKSRLTGLINWKYKP